MSDLRTFVAETAWPRLLAADTALLLLVRGWEARWVTRLMRALTRAGDTESWLVAGLALAFAGPGGTAAAGRLAGGAALALAVSQGLKRLCRRPRPATGIVGFCALAELPDAFSFPSGHTAVAFAVLVALGDAGAALATFFLVLAAGIAVSRVYLGAHYPLDVAAGAALGAACGLVVRLLLGA